MSAFQYDTGSDKEKAIWDRLADACEKVEGHTIYPRDAQFNNDDVVFFFRKKYSNLLTEQRFHRDTTTSAMTAQLQEYMDNIKPRTYGLYRG